MTYHPAGDWLVCGLGDDPARSPRIIENWADRNKTESQAAGDTSCGDAGEDEGQENGNDVAT